MEDNDIIFAYLGVRFGGELSTFWQNYYNFTTILTNHNLRVIMVPIIISTMEDAVDFPCKYALGLGRVGFDKLDNRSISYRANWLITDNYR
jgi:hypothetical protein